MEGAGEKDDCLGPLQRSWCLEHRGEISFRSDKRPLAMRQEWREKSSVCGGQEVDSIFSAKSKARATAEGYQGWVGYVS